MGIECLELYNIGSYDQNSIHVYFGLYGLYAPACMHLEQFKMFSLLYLLFARI